VDHAAGAESEEENRAVLRRESRQRPVERLLQKVQVADDGQGRRARWEATVALLVLDETVQEEKKDGRR